MKNPNSCETTFTQTTTDFIIEYVYGSKSLAEYDFPSIKDTYAHAKSVEISGSTVKVTVPMKQY